MPSYRSSCVKRRNRHVFPGNLQGRHAHETGAKGATLVEYAADEIQGVEHCELDTVRWSPQASPTRPSCTRLCRARPNGYLSRVPPRRSSVTRSPSTTATPMCGPLSGPGGSRSSVSYTHLTLPTNREV